MNHTRPPSATSQQCGGRFIPQGSAGTLDVGTPDISAASAADTPETLAGTGAGAGQGDPNDCIAAIKKQGPDSFVRKCDKAIIDAMAAYAEKTVDKKDRDTIVYKSFKDIKVGRQGRGMHKQFIDGASLDPACWAISNLGGISI